MTTINTEESYWLIYIKNEFVNNLNLYAEFLISCCDYTYFEYDVTFKSGYKLKAIDKKILLQYIKKYIDINFANSQYIVSTRSKDNSSLYYIVISIIQNSHVLAVASQVNSQPVVVNLLDK